MKKKVLIIALVLVIVIGIVAAVMFMNREEKPWKPSSSTTGSGNAGVTDDVTYGDVTDDDTASSPETDEVEGSETEKKPVSSETKKPETNKPETDRPETNKPETEKSETEKNDPPAKDDCSKGHNFGEWKEASKATCTSAGSQVRACKKCGEIETKQISAKGHKEVTVPGKEATCSSEGYTSSSKCSVCGAVLSSKTTLAKKNHSFGSWTTGKAATCGADGYNVRRCNFCGLEEKNTIKATGKHSYNASGCTVCGAALEGYKHLKYELSKDGTYYICMGFSSSYYGSRPSTIVVPSTYNGKPVKQISKSGSGNYAFCDISGEVKEIIISEGVEVIGYWAFWYCNALEKVTIPNSVNYIYNHSFSSCGMLEQVVINTSGWQDARGYSVDISNPYSAGNFFRSSQRYDISR